MRPPTDLSPFFAEWTNRAGRRVDFEPPAPSLVAPPHAAGGRWWHAALAQGGHVVFTDAAIALLAGPLLFQEDVSILDRQKGEPPDDDVAALGALLAQTLGTSPLSACGEPAGEESWIVPFSVAGLPASCVVLAQDVSDPLASEPSRDAGAAPPIALPPAFGPEPGVIPPLPARATAAEPRGGEALPPGRLTLLHVDANDARQARLDALFAARGWRVLHADCVRTVLDWCLAERVIDVVLIDPEWPRSARLRQNLGTDDRTRSLPILSPRTEDDDTLVREIIDAAIRKRLAEGPG